MRSFPASYLASPLCLGSTKKDVWNLVVERVERKLPIWKPNYLSIVGRIPLIKSVLGNLSVYLLLLFRYPASIINQIEKLQWDFLWHGRIGKEKFHLVDWTSVCKSRKDVDWGLGPLDR